MIELILEVGDDPLETSMMQFSIFWHEFHYFFT